MEGLKVFRVPSGFERALGRDTLRTRKNWDKLISDISTAPHIMMGVAEESPYIRRFHHKSFLSQRQKGYCVGFNTANTIMTLLRIPLGATANSGTPLPLIQVSPLYIYDISRMVAKNEGIRLGNGDGGIGSCAIKGCHKWGVSELDEYDSSPQAIDQHRNDTIPPSDVIKKAQEHLVNEFSICDSWNHGLEMMSAGFPITLCSEIPEGMMHTDAKGFFRMVGNVVGGHCVLPDATIGAPLPKRADSVQVGDSVIGHDGKLHRVSEVHVRDYDGDVLQFKGVGLPPVSFTPDHPVLVYQPLKTYGIKIRPEMDLTNYGGSTKYAKLAPQVITWQANQPVWVQASQVRLGDYLLTPEWQYPKEVVIPQWDQPLNKNSAARQHILPKIEAPSDDLAWFIGLYISDGNRVLKNGRVASFCITLSDWDSIRRAEKVVQSFGLKPKLEYRGTYVRFKVFNSSMARSLEQWCGGLSSEKKIPSFLYCGWNLRAVLEGMQAGDGSVNQTRGKDEYVISTISDRLRWQIWHLLVSLGERPKINEQKKDSPGRFANAKRLWHVRWTNDKGNSKGLETFRWNGFYALPVRGIEGVPYTGKVYNYEVEDVHSYLAGGIVCHNCYAMLDFSKKLNIAWISQAWEGWGEKTTDPTFTSMHGYTQIGTCPLDELERYFDQRKVGSGASEIYVANSVEGWTPKIVDYGPM